MHCFETGITFFTRDICPGGSVLPQVSINIEAKISEANDAGLEAVACNRFDSVGRRRLDIDHAIL